MSFNLLKDITVKLIANWIQVFLAASLVLIFNPAVAGTLSNLPLSLKSGVPPNVMFALSVEFPTAITPAYQDAASYSRNNSYLGYFDNNKCYTYYPTLNSGSVTGWFYPTNYSTTVSSVPHACTDNWDNTGGWSGNFLNWATMAGLDEFRFAMTGGNRVVDLADSDTNPGGLTVLQRSYQTGQGSNFITKTFTEDGYTTGYPSGTALTITNKGNGTQMAISQSGSPPPDTAVCESPGGTHGCSSFRMVNTGDLVTCTTWTGTGAGAGTVTSPYQCTVFTDPNRTLTNPPTAGSVSILPGGGSLLPITGNYMYYGTLPAAAAANGVQANEYWPGSYTAYNWASNGNGTTNHGSPYTTTTSSQMVFFGADTTSGSQWAVLNVPSGTPLYCSNTWYQTANPAIAWPIASYPGDPYPFQSKACYIMPTPPAGTNGTVTAACNGMSSGNPVCTFTLSNATSGATTTTCNQWSGTGTSASPYICNSFGNFTPPASSLVFNTTTNPTTSALCTSPTNPTCTIPTSYTNSNENCTVATSSPYTTTCTQLGSGNNVTATCSSYTGSGTSGSPYVCSSFTTASPATTYSGIGCVSGYTATANSKYYCTRYNMTGTTQVNGSIYYGLTYTGIYGPPNVYYYSTYSVTYGTSANYNINVQVCNSSTGIEDNCTLYGDGSTYKPTGVLQNNQNMRFGVTSYFNATDIDNAVLRAKAKYLSPQQYLSAGALTPNLAAEWSETDGTFVNNPDSADSSSWFVAGTNSGVINYINKFGTVSHSYKTYDDIGKLYYETLRYLRGGNLTGASTGTFTPTPTTDFYNGAKTSNSDGFPVINVWDDPVQYTCQKNYIITMGDVHTWCDKRLPGGAFTATNSSTCNAYTDSNSHAHLADSGSLSGDTGIVGKIIYPPTPTTKTIAASTGVKDAMDAIALMEHYQISTYPSTLSTTNTGAGGASYSMAGLAAWAATNNIRPDKAPVTAPMHVKTFVIDVQESGDCDYQLNFWMAAKYGDPANYIFNAGTGDATWNGNGSWYNQILGNSISCSSNGPPNYGTTSQMNWPKDLLRAGNPAAMISSVNSALQSIAAEQGSESALSQSAGTLNTGTGAYIYQGSYNSGGWTGDLKAFVIDTNGVTTSTADWTASAMLPVPSARTVFTFNRTTHAGITFTPDSLSIYDTYQQGILNMNINGVTDNRGQDRVRYIRGDMSKEAYLPSTSGATTPNTLTNYGWRSRLAVGTTGYTTASYTVGPTGQIGDIIGSNSAYVGPPVSPIPDATYKTFASAHTTRTPMIYVGSNDGMLHGFNASYTLNSSNLPTHTTNSGKEVFAYVPYAVFPNLPNLMSSSFQHRYYVDGSPLAADACNTPCSASTDWKTMLVGSLNGGGKGIFALDVTDPVTSVSSSNVLWEFTSLDDADLGYSYSQPIVAKLNNGHWAVIFGNGFNSVDSANAGNNNAYLYILYVDPDLSTNSGWVLNTNYFKIALTSPGTPNNASNGLAGITALDSNLDGKVDYIYGGDRNGNMWKINLTSSTPSSWAPSFSGAPLYTAKDAANHVQQITNKPVVATNPNGGYMVMFGTGSWIDNTDTNPQSGTTFYTDTLYGIWDQNSGASASPATGRSVLQRQATIASISVDNTGATCTTGANCTLYTVQSSCAPNYSTVALPAPGNTSLTGNQSNLCPLKVPVPPAYTTYSTTTLASPTGTTQQFGWYFDLLGNGERSHSNPPTLIGTAVEFTSLTPSTNPCSGNTSGFEYNFNYLTGGSPLPIYILPGSTSITTAGITSFTPPGSSTPISVVLSGKALSGGAALNPIIFNAGNQAAAQGGVNIQFPPGMPTVVPANCTAGNCTAANFYIPGWGFLTNVSTGPSGIRYIFSCTNSQSGALPVCTLKQTQGQFGQLSWKQIN
jgi:type IV pilus assembly protein PilY1